jgi:hypothetical protein
VLLRERGKLTERKVALLQTKRLYSREIPVVEFLDFTIGFGGRTRTRTWGPPIKSKDAAS